MLVTVHASFTDVVASSAANPPNLLHPFCMKLGSALASSTALHSMETHHFLVKCVLCHFTCLIRIDSTKCAALALLCSTPTVTKLLSALPSLLQ